MAGGAWAGLIHLPKWRRQCRELRETREVRVSSEKPEKNEPNRKMTLKVAKGSMSVEY